MGYINIEIEENEININLACTQHERWIAILELLKGVTKESIMATQYVLNEGKKLAKESETCK